MEEDSYLETPFDVFDICAMENDQHNGYSSSHHNTAHNSPTSTSRARTICVGKHPLKPLSLSSEHGNRNKLKQKRGVAVYALHESSDSEEEDGEGEGEGNEKEGEGSERGNKNSTSISGTTRKRPLNSSATISTNATITTTTITTTSTTAPPLPANTNGEVNKTHTVCLTRGQRSEFHNWLVEYRKRWPMYWNYMDNAVVTTIIRDIPMTKEELGRIPKVGQTKAQRYGDHILATVWAFLSSHNLLEHFPSALQVRPSIPDCPTWLDPVSEAADEIRAKPPAAITSTVTGLHTGGNMGGITVNTTYVSAIATTTAIRDNNSSSNFSSPGHPHSSSPYFAGREGNTNIYSPTDHSPMGGFSELKNPVSNLNTTTTPTTTGTATPPHEESQIIDMTTPPGVICHTTTTTTTTTTTLSGVYQTHTLNKDHTCPIPLPIPPSPYRQRQQKQLDTCSPLSLPLPPPHRRRPIQLATATSTTAISLPSADSVYGTSNGTSTSSMHGNIDASDTTTTTITNTNTTKRVYSMEY